MKEFSYSLPSLEGQKILITGGLGFIGSNLAHRCLDLGAKVTIYDCLDPKSGGNMFNVKEIEDSIDIILKDIRSFEGISACIRRQDVLFNCAAYTSHPNSMKEPLIDIEVNCKGVINMLEAARRFNSKLKIVHIGTSTQIGRMQFNPVNERHPEFPMDIYSANKTASEKYILIYGSAYQMNTTVVRLANVFGPRSNIKSPEFGFMNYFVGLALQDKDLTVFGDGSQFRNINYVEDCVEALILASQSEASNCQAFFAVADQQYSVWEISQAIVSHIGGRVRSVEWPKDREVIDIGDAIISNDKIKTVLHWAPKHDLAGGLRKTAEYFRPFLNNYL